MIVLFFFVALTYLTEGSNYYVGPITITEDGQQVTRHLMSHWAPPITVSGSSVSIPHGYSVQVAKTRSDSYNSDIFMKYKLQV